MAGLGATAGQRNGIFVLRMRGERRRAYRRRLSCLHEAGRFGQLDALRLRVEKRRLRVRRAQAELPRPAQRSGSQAARAATAGLTPRRS